MYLIDYNFLKMENFIAIKFLNPRFVEALIMWWPRHKAGPDLYLFYSHTIVLIFFLLNSMKGSVFNRMNTL